MKILNIKNNKKYSHFIKLYLRKCSSKYSKGYAVLFTLVVISIISMISMGLANTALKQIVLSGVARDSTVAFYEADLGGECTLYGDNNSDTIFPTNVGSSLNWDCAGHSLRIVKTNTGYTIDPVTVDNNKCFRATITKANVGAYVETTADIRGYNICDTSNIRTVERAIRIKY